MPNFDIISEHVGTIAAPFQRNASSEPVPSVEATPLNYNSNFSLYDPLGQLSLCLSCPLVPHTGPLTPAKQPRHTIVTSAVWVDSKGTVQRIWRTTYQASKDLRTSEVLGQLLPTNSNRLYMGYARMFCQWICLLLACLWESSLREGGWRCSPQMSTAPTLLYIYIYKYMRVVSLSLFHTLVVLDVCGHAMNMLHTRACIWRNIGKPWIELCS